VQWRTIKLFAIPRMRSSCDDRRREYIINKGNNNHDDLAVPGH
jgi:hypothetical protein